MIKQEFTARTVEDAINEGLATLNLTRASAKITVLEKGGFFKKAKVLISGPETEGARALDFVEGLYEKMGVACTCELTEDEESANINVISVDSSAIIGYRGDVLDAVQYLASIVGNEGKETFKRIVVDCEDYRARRIATLEGLAKKLADKAVKSGRAVKLEPMKSFERRVIHSVLVDDERVTTASFGEEPNRYLVITPKNLKDRKDFKKGGYKGKKKGGKKDFNKKPSNSSAPRRSKSTPIEGGFSVYGFYGNSGANKSDS